MREWATEKIRTDVFQIEKAECEISNAEKSSELICVKCLSEYYSPGVSLEILADDFIVYSESTERVEIHSLRKTVRKYWKTD